MTEQTMTPGDVLAADSPILDVLNEAEEALQGLPHLARRLREAKVDVLALIARNAELEAESIGRSLGEVHALIAENSALTSERDAYRDVLREFQDGRRVHNPHTRQVARDIEQQALARAEGCGNG